VVNRNHVQCHTCNGVLAIRVTVAGGLQRFMFPCPYCGTQLTGSFYAEQPTGPPDPDAVLKPFEIKSEDFDLLDYDAARETPDMLSVAINTELPVHVSLLSMPVTEVRLTPFMQLVAEAGEGVADTIERVNVLRQMRFELLPSVRRAATAYAANDIERLRGQLTKVPGFEESPFAEADPWAGISALLQGFLRVIGAEPGRIAAREELAGLLERAGERDAGAVRSLLADYARRALPQHRRGVLDTVVAALEASDALVAGMCLEAAPGLDLDEFRIQRADFDELKVRYQDLFELASRTLVLPAALANVDYRGDAREYCDGIRRSLKDALNAKASAREAWLPELPAAQKLYNDSARKTRNLIGHRLVTYDYAQASLIDDKGNAHNYLLFLRDYLAAVRGTAYMLDIVELMTTFEQHGI
jgi:hypothetical protein